MNWKRVIIKICDLRYELIEENFWKRKFDFWSCWIKVYFSKINWWSKLYDGNGLFDVSK